MSTAAIRTRYPDGLRELAPSLVWDTLAGQPTDDGEFMLALAHSIAIGGAYRPEQAQQFYQDWRVSDPFDCGATIGAALRGTPNPTSQANGALMRQAPLAVWGIPRTEPATTFEDAIRDGTALTHPHPVCQAASVAHLTGLRLALRAAQQRGHTPWRAGGPMRPPPPAWTAPSPCCAPSMRPAPPRRPRGRTRSGC